MSDADVSARPASLEAEVSELGAVQDVLLRLLSTTRRLSRLLEQYGATFGYLQMRLAVIFPDLAADREFVQFLIDTLKVERPAYRSIHAYARAARWLA
jgi:hypothetical protein